MNGFRSVQCWIALTLTLTCGVALTAMPSTSIAQEATPQAQAIPPNCTVVASGLFNPRDVALGSDGTLYIAEAGDGGEETIFMPTDANTPVATEVLTMVGDSGQISIVAPDGTQSVLVSGLPSYTFGPEIVGPSGVTVVDGTLYATVGGPGPAVSVVPERENVNSVIAVDIATGSMQTIADIGAYEQSNNPDPYWVDSNLGGLAVASDGMLYVADAGGNAVYKVDPTTGELSVFSVIPGLPVPDVQNPDRGGRAENDPVPTDVALAPDGGVYVSLLSGAIGWGTPGGAKVIQIAADGTITDAITDLNLVVSVATAADGSIVVSQISENFFAQPPAPGVVATGSVGGAATPVVSNLPFPYGVAVADDGALYIAINSTAPMGTPPSGQVLRCTPDTATTVETQTVTIEALDILFSPRAITIPAHTPVNLRIVNNGVAPHQLSVNDLDLHSPVVMAGESVTITINAAPGTYGFYCGVPGHRQAGMGGILTVQ